MKEFNDYDKKYPNLVMDILDYFKIESGVDNKSILKFCTIHGKKNGGGVDFVYQPEIVSRICQKLCKKINYQRCEQVAVWALTTIMGLLSVINKSGNETTMSCAIIIIL